MSYPLPFGPKTVDWSNSFDVACFGLAVTAKATGSALRSAIASYILHEDRLFLRCGVGGAASTIGLFGTAALLTSVLPSGMKKSRFIGAVSFAAGTALSALAMNYAPESVAGRPLSSLGQCVAYGALNTVATLLIV